MNTLRAIALAENSTIDDLCEALKNGACRGTGTESFFPVQSFDTNHIDHPSHDAAKAICATCAVATECLAVALTATQHYDFGIWGGTSSAERRHIRHTYARIRKAS